MNHSTLIRSAQAARAHALRNGDALRADALQERIDALRDERTAAGNRAMRRQGARQEAQRARPSRLLANLLQGAL